MSSEDITCEICLIPTSKEPNEIVICDRCGKGYHQLCHNPKIPEAIIGPNLPWVCRNCFYNMTIQEKIDFKIIDMEKKKDEDNNVLSEEYKVIKNSKSTSCSSAFSSSESSNESSNKNQTTAQSDCSSFNNFDFDDSNEICKKLPYDLKNLEWDEEHLTNSNNVYCYCARGVEYCRSMLQCWTCKQWFHTFCIKSLQDELLIGDQYFKFVCSVCNEKGESCKRIIMKWSVVIGLTLSNLTYGSERHFFNINTDIIPFLIENENLFKLPISLNGLSKEHLFNKIEGILKDNLNNFICNEEGNWSLKISMPYEDPLTYSPLSTNQASTLAKQKAQEQKFKQYTANKLITLAKSKKEKKEEYYDGAVRKSCSSVVQPNKTTKLKSKKQFPRKRSNSINSTESSNLNSVVKRKRVRKSPNSLLKRNDSSEDILNLDVVIPYPENFEGKNNPFNPFYCSTSNSNSVNKEKEYFLSDDQSNESIEIRCPLNNSTTCNQRSSRLSTSSDTAEYRITSKDINKLVLSRVNSGTISNSSLNSENSLPSLNSSSTNLNSSNNSLSINCSIPQINSSNLNSSINTSYLKLNGTSMNDDKHATKTIKEDLKILGSRKTQNGLEIMYERTQQEQD